MTAELELELYNLADLTTPIRALPSSWDRRVAEVKNEAGSGEFAVQHDDPALADLYPMTPANVVRVTYRGEYAFAFVPNFVPERITIARPKAQKHTRFSGPGLLEGILGRSPIYPSLGVGAIPIQEDRVFNFTVREYDDSASPWEAGTVVTTIATAKVSWPVPWDPEYPDDTASIIWDNDGQVDEAIPGTVYGRQIIDVAAGDYVLYAGADNYGEIYANGTLVASPGQSTGSFSLGFLSTERVPVTLTEGENVIAWRCVSIPFTEGNESTSEADNPAGFVWSIYTPDPTGELGQLIAHSDSSARILARPAEPPGMTTGQALLILRTEGVDRGDLPSALNPTFTEELDTNGDPFPILGDIATKVGYSLFTFGREQSNTYIDWRLVHNVDDGTLDWDVYVKGAMPSACSAVFAEGTNIEAMRHSAESMRGNAGLLRAAAGLGWLERLDATSIAEFGRVGMTIGLGALGSEAEAYRVADETFAEFGYQREQSTAAIRPSRDEDRPYVTDGFVIGNVAVAPDASGASALREVTGITLADHTTNRKLALVGVTFGEHVLTQEQRAHHAIGKMVNGTDGGRIKAAQPVVPEHRPRGLVVVVPPFDPGLVTGLWAWYDAADATTISASGSDVTEWRDKSGNNRDLTPAAPSNSPSTGTRTLNGLNVIDYDRANTETLKFSGAFGLGQPITTYVVMIHDDPTVQQRWIIAESDVYLLSYDGFANRRPNIFATVTQLDAPTNSMQNAGSYLIRTILNGGSSSITVNGSTASGGVGSESASGPLEVGNNGTALYLDGAFAEILIVDGSVSAEDDAALIAYLEAKWGL